MSTWTQGGNDEIVLSLKNTGGQAINATDIDVFVYDSQRVLNVTLINLDWSDEAFRIPGRKDTVTMFVNQSEHSDFLVPNKFYMVSLEFTTTGTTVNAGSCEATRAR